MLGCSKGHYTIEGLKNDSRGISLNIGDYVLWLLGGRYGLKIDIYRVWHSLSGDRILVDLNNNEASFNTSTKYYLLKIDMTEEQFKELNERYERALMGPYYRHFTVTNYALALEEQYKQKENKSSLRDFGIRDYLDRKLSPGSLVLYTGKQTLDKESTSISYGILVSDRKIFTEHLTMVAPHHVIVLDNWTYKEKELYSNLIRQFKQQAITPAGGVRIGDIYRTESHVYLYLGPCEVVWKKTQNSNVKIEYKQDTKKGRWLDLGKSDISTINRMMDINRTYLDTRLQRMCRVVKSERRKKQLTEDLYAVYQCIVDFPSLVYDIGEELSFAGNIQLNKEMVMSDKDALLYSYDLKVILK